MVIFLKREKLVSYGMVYYLLTKPFLNKITKYPPRKYDTKALYHISTLLDQIKHPNAKSEKKWKKIAKTPLFFKHFQKIEIIFCLSQ